MLKVCVAIAESQALGVGGDGQIMAAQRGGGLADGGQNFSCLTKTRDRFGCGHAPAAEEVARARSGTVRAGVGESAPWARRSTADYPDWRPER